MKNKPQFSFPLRLRFMLYIGGLILFSGAVLFTLSFLSKRNTINTLYDQRNKALVKSYALSILNQLNLNNELAMDNISAQYAEEKGVAAAYVLNGENRYESHSEPGLLGETHPLYKMKGTKKNAGGLLEYYSAVNARGQIVYIFTFPIRENLIAQIEVSYIERTRQLLRYLTRFTLIFGLLILLALVLAQVVALRLSQPIKELTKGVNIIAQGNFDHKIPQTSKDEIGMLTNEFNRMTGEIKKAQEMKITQERLNRELEIAAEIQKNLIPSGKVTLPGYSIQHYYSPAKEIGGDYYDFFPVSDSKTGVVLSDVSGKGIPAALVMSMLKTIFSSLSKVQIRPEEVLKISNRLLRENISKGVFASTFFGILDHSNDQLSYSMAGCEKILTWIDTNHDIREIHIPGFPLGMQDDPLFSQEISSRTISLKPGQCLLLYTDGLTDIRHPEQGIWERKGLIDFLKNDQGNFDDLSERLVKATREYRGSSRQEDDLSLILIRKNSS